MRRWLVMGVLVSVAGCSGGSGSGPLGASSASPGPGWGACSALADGGWLCCQGRNQNAPINDVTVGNTEPGYSTTACFAPRVRCAGHVAVCGQPVLVTPTGDGATTSSPTPTINFASGTCSGTEYPSGPCAIGEACSVASSASTLSGTCD